MPHIDYFFATVSPFTYLAAKRVDAIAHAHGATMTYKPLDVTALFARTGGTLPNERHISRQEYRAQDLARRATALDMPLNPKPAFWPANAAPSSYAIIAAQSAGGGDLAELAHSFNRACWAEDRNIADDEVICELLANAGFDPGLANSGLLAGAGTYEANLEEAVSRGVFGVPFCITDGDQRFWGQDRLDDLDRCLSQGR